MANLIARNTCWSHPKMLMRTLFCPERFWFYQTLIGLIHPQCFNFPIAFQSYLSRIIYIWVFIFFLQPSSSVLLIYILNSFLCNTQSSTIRICKQNSGQNIQPPQFLYFSAPVWYKSNSTGNQKHSKVSSWRTLFLIDKHMKHIYFKYGQAVIPFY